MRILPITAGCIATLFLGACDIDVGIRGNGQIVTKQQQVGPFTEISGRGSLRIDWKSGPPSVSVTTDENLADELEARTSGNRLELRMRNRVRPTHGIKISVTSPSLNGARLSGASDLTVKGLSGPVFAVETSGASSIVLDGTVAELLAELTGASELRARDLHVKTAEISTTGAADAWVNVSEKLRVAITGAGDVTYSGNPPTIERRITGAGTIHHKE